MTRPRYYIANAGRILYCRGEHSQADAELMAENAARQRPGKTYAVIVQVKEYRFPRRRDKSK